MTIYLARFQSLDLFDRQIIPYEKFLDGTPRTESKCIRWLVYSLLLVAQSSHFDHCRKIGNFTPMPGLPNYKLDSNHGNAGGKLIF